MPILISSNLRGYSIFSSSNNSSSKFIVISFHNVGQVVVLFELSFENREGVLYGIVIWRIRREEFKLKVCICNEIFECL
jgi:hypothetical protein